MAPVVEVRGLRKAYGAVEAVAGVDLTVERGEVFALLGPNGAGKTTIVEILEGYRDRTGGSASVLGHDPSRGRKDFKERIGIVLQETGLEPYLTVEEAVDLFRGYFPNPRSRDEVLEVVGLTDVRRARVNKLSGGQRRRLDVAIGLAGDPELLFLDEPTTGFDPAARRNAWDMIANLQALGTTVFLTTHYMDEAQQLSDRVGIIVSGRIVAEGEPGILTARAGDARIRFRVPPGHTVPERVDASTIGDRVEISTARPTAVLHELTAWALERDLELEGLTVSRATLEDVYLELTRTEDAGR
jgi:ABC-2 type transport system ATP-binding protein